MFAGEGNAVLDHLPTLEGGAFFEAQSAGDVAVQLEEMKAEELLPAGTTGGVMFRCRCYEHL